MPGTLAIGWQGVGRRDLGGDAGKQQHELLLLHAGSARVAAGRRVHLCAYATEATCLLENMLLVYCCMYLIRAYATLDVAGLSRL